MPRGHQAHTGQKGSTARHGAANRAAPENPGGEETGAATLMTLFGERDTADGLVYNVPGHMSLLAVAHLRRVKRLRVLGDVLGTLIADDAVDDDEPASPPRVDAWGRHRRRGGWKSQAHQQPEETRLGLAVPNPLVRTCAPAA